MTERALPPPWRAIIIAASAVIIVAGSGLAIWSRTSSRAAEPGRPIASVQAPPVEPTPLDNSTDIVEKSVEPTSSVTLSPPTIAPAPTATPPASMPDSVRIAFKTVPRAAATVEWGKTRLGTIHGDTPLVVERPRDSGPLDVVIRARGYLPVSVRAYTFTDSTLEVRITPRSKKDTLYGYRVPLPPPPDEESNEEPDL